MSLRPFGHPLGHVRPEPTPGFNHVHRAAQAVRDRAIGAAIEEMGRRVAAMTGGDPAEIISAIRKIELAALRAGGSSPGEQTTHRAEGPNQGD